MRSTSAIRSSGPSPSVYATLADTPPTVTLPSPNMFGRTVRDVLRNAQARRR